MGGQNIVRSQDGSIVDGIFPGRRGLARMLVVAEDDLIRCRRLHYGYTSEAQEYLLPIWKLESETKDLRPFLGIFHNSVLGDLQHELVQEVMDLMGKPPPYQDTRYYQPLIHILDGCIKQFRRDFFIILRILNRKLNGIINEVNRRVSEPEFFERMGITLEHVQTMIRKVTKMQRDAFKGFCNLAWAAEDMYRIHNTAFENIWTSQIFWIHVYPDLSRLILNMVISYLLDLWFVIFSGVFRLRMLVIRLPRRR